eukprot:4505350-Amphidinium_carterae.1
MKQPSVHDLTQDDSDQEELAKGAWDDFFAAPKIVGTRFDEVAAEELRATSRLALHRHRTSDRSHRTRLSEEHQELSRFLARVLRYRAIEMGLVVDADGYVPVATLLDMPEMQGIPAEELLHVAEVSEGSKGRRFAVRSDTCQGPAVKAAYTHPTRSDPLPPHFVSEALQRLLRRHLVPADQSRRFGAEVSPYGGNNRRFGPSSIYNSRRLGSCADVRNSAHAIDN